MRSTGSPVRAGMLGVMALLFAVLAGCAQSNDPGASGGAGQGAAPAPAPAPIHLVAFSRNGRIGIMKPDGSNAVLLSDGSADLNPVWSPDGKSIAFQRYWPVDQKGTYVMKADGSDPKKVSPGAFFERPPVWSPDSQSLLVNDPDASKERFGLWLAKADGAGETRLLNMGPIQGAAWSPDGKTIAFTFNPAGTTGGLYFVSPTGGEPKVVLDVPNGGMFQAGPVSFSPDGSHIAVRATPIIKKDATDVPPPTLTIAKVGSDGAVTVAHKVEGAYLGLWTPAWSPDSTKVAFIQRSSSGGQQLAIAARETGKVDVAGESKDLQTPVWSPDGKHILVASVNATQPDGQVLRFTTDGKTTTTDTVTSGSSVAWSNVAFTGALPAERAGTPSPVVLRTAQFSWKGWD